MAGEWLAAGLPRRPFQFSRTREDYGVSFQPERGPPKRRPGTTVRRQRYDLSFQLTGAQLARFWAFHEAFEFKTFLFPDPYWRPDLGMPDEVVAEFVQVGRDQLINNDRFQVSMVLLLHQ